MWDWTNENESPVCSVTLSEECGSQVIVLPDDIGFELDVYLITLNFLRVTKIYY